MERDESTSWLRSGAPALLVRLMRVAGLAPLVLGPHGVRISRALSSYGKVLITGLCVFIMLYKPRDDRIFNSGERNSPTQTVVLIIAYINLMSVLLIGTYFSTCRMKVWLVNVKKIERVKKQLTHYHSSKSETRREKAVIILTIIALAMLSMANISHIINTIMFMFGKLIEMQLVLTHRYIIGLLSSFTDSLERSLRDLEDHHTDIASQDNLVTVTNKVFSINVPISPRSINRVTDMLGALPPASPRSTGVAATAPYQVSLRTYTCYQKWNTRAFTLAHSGTTAKQKQHIKICNLNGVFTDICELVDDMNNGIDGIIMFVCVLNCAAHVFWTIYNFIRSLGMTPFHLRYMIVEGLWFLFHIINMSMIIAAGHRLVQLNQQVGCCVSKLLGKTHLYSDDIRRELQKIFMTLTLNKPVFCPLGMFTLNRKLILTIIGVIVTYLVILEQFPATE